MVKLAYDYPHHKRQYVADIEAYILGCNDSERILLYLYVVDSLSKRLNYG
jgi:hypothetical protein